jgi:hypothetical protein
LTLSAENKHMIRRLLIMILITVSSILFSQEVFAPFVSKISIESDGTQIILSWKDSNDVSGKYLIFRSSEVLTESVVTTIEPLAEVLPGVEIYIDKPQSDGPWYYAVIGSSDQNETYPYLIPYRNTLLTGTSLSDVEASTVVNIEDYIDVTGIVATVVNDTIQIRFSRSKNEGTLILLQNAEPIVDAEDIENSIRLSALENSINSYTDSPVPGISYYYAVLDLAALETGQFTLNKGQNVLESAVSIDIGDRVALNSYRPSSIIPLPFLTLRTSILSDAAISAPLSTTLPKRTTMTAATQKLVNQLLSSLPQKSEASVRPVLLSSDRIPQELASGKTLQSILKNEFLEGDYDKTIELLNLFLTNSRESKIESRTHFYLGQSYYFKGEYLKAVREFLYAEDDYYQDVQFWLNNCYRQLESVLSDS